MNLSSRHFNLNKTGVIPNVLSLTFHSMVESNLCRTSPIACLECPAILNWSQPTPGGSWTCLFCKKNNRIKDAHELPTNASENLTVFLLEECNLASQQKYIIFCIDTSGSMSTTLLVSVIICNYILKIYKSHLKFFFYL